MIRKKDYKRTEVVTQLDTLTSNIFELKKEKKDALNSLYILKKSRFTWRPATILHVLLKN